MSLQPTCYYSSKIEGRRGNGTRGNRVFARYPVHEGEVLVVWGGEVRSREELMELDQENRGYVLQIEDDLFMITAFPGPGDWVNHSCAPNAGLRGQVVLVAMRDIAPGEEITYDYAMTDTTGYDEFACSCGAAECRGSITGSDWQRPELWERYRGYFAPHVQRRIDALAPLMVLSSRAVAAV